MNGPRQFPWWAILLGFGCIGVICIGVLVVGGGAAFFLTRQASPPSIPTPVVVLGTAFIEPTTSVSPTIEPAAAEPTFTPILTTEPPLIEPTATEQVLTDGQYVNEYSLMDDFSSQALGWPIFDDGKTILKYENQAYSFQITEPDYHDWAYFPADFIPYEIWFDVQGPDGPQDGTFGVFCQFQDVENYYYVEFDLADNTYLIGQILAGDNIPLTAENTSGQYWISTSELKASPSSVNRIGISCYMESITLFINDQWVDEVSVSQPFDQPGEAAFFVYVFDFASEQGYKVFFDNVEAYQPVQ